jgi:hypothetical protein
MVSVLSRLIAACAAANLATGTRYGEQDTQFVPTGLQDSTELGSPSCLPRVQTSRFDDTLGDSLTVPGYRAYHRTMCRLLLIVLLSISAFGQVSLPTEADLDATIAKWNDATRPGRIMRTRSRTPTFLLTEDVFSDIEDAERIHDTEIVIELVKTGKAFVESSPVRVRILGAVDSICPAFRVLQMECHSGPDKLRGFFKELTDWHTSAGRRRILGTMKRAGGGTPEEFEKRMATRAVLFRQHDISIVWSHYYANVRVLDGKHIGDRGYIKFTELQPQ